MRQIRITFANVAGDLIKDADARASNGDCAATLPRDYRQRLRAYCEPFFGNMAVADIDARKLREFRQWLTAKNLSGSTIRTIQAFVSMVLKMAVDDGYLAAAPRISRPSQKDAPRPSFTTSEWRVLLTTLKRLEKRSPAVAFKGTPIDKELRRLVTFQSNTFLRPGDLFTLKNRHIEVIDEVGADGRQFLRLNPPPSKGHAGPIVSMKAAVPIYRRILQDQKQAGFGRPDDFVFMPKRMNRTYAREVASRLFSLGLHEAGLKYAADGAERTLYSVRHYAITSRLANAHGLDVVTLARNCRTSAEMIDRFYASSLTPEMNLEKIQSFKRESRYA